MSQDATGGVQANAAGAAFRAALNVSLAAIITNNSGASAPTTTYAYMFWADTTTGLLKQRDSLNASWIIVGNMGSAYLGLLQLAGGNMTGAVNYARTTVASAATPDIWTGTGNVINYTGTATATGFAAAPQAGATRILDCAAAAVFTAGANMLIDGVASGSNLTVVAGDRVKVLARTATQFVLTQIPAGGTGSLSSSIKGLAKNYAASAIGINNYNVVVTADEAVLENSANQYVTVRTISKTINANGTVGNPLSIMSARAASTWYYVWLWYNATLGLTATLDISSTAPTAPAGYASTDYNARMPGAVRTDASGSTYLLQLKTQGKRTQWVPLATSNVTLFPVFASGAQGSVSVPTWVAIAWAAVAAPMAIALGLGVTDGGGGNTMVHPDNTAGTPASTTNPPMISRAVGAGNFISNPALIPVEGSNIYYASDTASGLLFCHYWEEA